MSVIADLERLIADPGRRHRHEFANSYAINALQNLADAEAICIRMRLKLWMKRGKQCGTREN